MQLQHSTFHHANAGLCLLNLAQSLQPSSPAEVQQVHDDKCVRFMSESTFHQVCCPKGHAKVEELVMCFFVSAPDN